MINPPYLAVLRLLPALCMLLLGCMTATLNDAEDLKILEAAHNYHSSLERGELEALLRNSVRSNREIMQPCLDNLECASELRRDILFVKMRDFKVNEIKDSLTPPGKIVFYSATRVFGESQPPSQQAGSGELLFIREDKEWKMASVSWLPQK